MDNFTSYFIGIPLPEKYQSNFEDLLEKIPQLNSLFKSIYSKTPHVTVCYLDKQPQNNIPKIAEHVKSYLEMLKGVELKVGGFGYFSEDDPRVLFLNVEYSKELEEFNKVITKSLSVYSDTDQNLPFHPHATVSWIGDPKAQQAFKTQLTDIKALLDKVEWSFEIDEVVLYGADSTKQPEYQEKLISLKIG